MFIIRKLLLWKATTWQPTTNRPFQKIPLTFLNCRLGRASREPYFGIIFCAQFTSVCQKFPYSAYLHANSVVLHSFWVTCSLVPLSFLNVSRSLSTREVSSGFAIEAGTRRLITTYFGICSRLLCILFAAFLFFVWGQVFYLSLSSDFELSLSYMYIIQNNRNIWEQRSKFAFASLLDNRHSFSHVNIWIYDIHFGPALHQHYINSPTWFEMIIAAITINGPMLDSPECNKLFVSAIALWSEKRNRRKLPPKVSKETELTALAELFSVRWSSLSDRCLWEHYGAFRFYYFVLIYSLMPWIQVLMFYWHWDYRNARKTVNVILTSIQTLNVTNFNLISLHAVALHQCSSFTLVHY